MNTNKIKLYVNNKLKILDKEYLLILYESMMFFLAIMSIILMFDNNEVHKSYNIKDIDLYIYIIFMLDVIIRLSYSKNKKLWLKKNYLDIIAIIPLDLLFMGFRIFRIFRLLRLAIMVNRFGKTVLTVLKKHQLYKPISVCIMLFMMSGFLITLVEPEINKYSDGLWWVIVTVTTVGYGDIYPTTIAGRIIAGILMIVGISLFGRVIAELTTVVIDEDEEDKYSEDINYLVKNIKSLPYLTNNEIDNLIIRINKYKE